MTLTLLLDLDDTLLNINQSVFAPAYFQALAKELAPQVKPEITIRALLAGRDLMNASEDFSHTLKEVFESVFFSQAGISREQIEPYVENFYNKVFPTLQGLTSQKPDAKPFVDWALSQGFRVAIATDPLLPRTAMDQRLRWAGFVPEQFEVVSSYEHFYFSKTHPAYYAEVLGRMGWVDGPVLMVGNDMERDILPAKKLGLAAYYANGESASPSENEARGTLSDLRTWIESVDLATLVPSFNSVDSVWGILSATPAVMNSLSREFDPLMWLHKFTPDDWSLTEVVCHLRDTEREVHHAQIKLFKGLAEPFIPRPDTSVWASQRNYLHENGADALREFNAARRETIDVLKSVSLDEWNRKARHAIFGPTNFLEVARFIADHDRMHIQQAWSALKKT